MTQLGGIGVQARAQPVHAVLQVLTDPLVIAGLGLDGLGAAARLVVLPRVPLSLPYPALAVNSALTTLLARRLLGENGRPRHWLGRAVLRLGVVLVART